MIRFFARMLKDKRIKRALWIAIIAPALISPVKTMSASWQDHIHAQSRQVISARVSNSVAWGTLITERATPPWIVAGRII